MKYLMWNFSCPQTCFLFPCLPFYLHINTLFCKPPVFRYNIYFYTQDSSLWDLQVELHMVSVTDLYRMLALNTRCFTTVWCVKLAGSSSSHCILGQETIYSTHPHLAFGCVTVHFTFI